MTPRRRPSDPAVRIELQAVEFTYCREWTYGTMVAQIRSGVVYNYELETAA
jgi:hypothetical protein